MLSLVYVDLALVFCFWTSLKLHMGPTSTCLSGFFTECYYSHDIIIIIMLQYFVQ